MATTCTPHALEACSSTAAAFVTSDAAAIVRTCSSNTLILCSCLRLASRPCCVYAEPMMLSDNLKLWEFMLASAMGCACWRSTHPACVGLPWNCDCTSRSSSGHVGLKTKPCDVCRWGDKVAAVLNVISCVQDDTEARDLATCRSRSRYCTIVRHPT